MESTDKKVKQWLSACAQEERDKLRGQVKAKNQSGSAAEGRLQERDATIAALRTSCDDATRRAADLEATVRKLRSQVESAQAESARATARCSALDSQLVSTQASAAAAADQASLQVRGLIKTGWHGAPAHRAQCHGQSIRDIPCIHATAEALLPRRPA
jgi:chromosome segregation ATPase